MTAPQFFLLVGMIHLAPLLPAKRQYWLARLYLAGAVIWFTVDLLRGA